MTTRNSLCGGAALGALLALTLAPVAFAATHHRHAPVVVVREDPAVKEEVDELKQQVAALEDWKNQQAQTQAQTQAQVSDLQGQLTQANARAEHAEQQVAAEIQTLPTQVDTDIAKHAPKTDKIYYKGITLTLGGFAAAEGVYRSRNDVADIGSNYAKIPYNNAVLAHTNELRGTARQSRVSFLAQGNINPNLVASFYGELDFLAGPQTANSNESNSFSPRIRNVYGALDWTDSGWHLLAGQNWSLATMNGKGISPRNEIIPATIEAQYVPGFVWARQPQLRIVKDFGKQAWVAVSLENPQTTFGSAATGTATTFGGVTITDNATAISQFDSANSLSFNHAPDMIGKVAFEPVIGGAQPLHVEVFGLLRNYYDRVSVVAAAGSQAAAAGLTTGNFTDSSTGGGVGGGFTLNVVPKLLDVQGSFLTGRGIGRYGAGQLPDTIVGPDGSLKPIPETMFLGGVTLHATPQLDLYVYGGQESESAATNNTTFGATTVHLGYGNAFATLGNCFVEGGSCSPDTQKIDQVTVGLWDKAYTGTFGQLRIGLQYSHTNLTAFQGVAGTNTAGIPVGNTVRPSTSDDMVFTSFRYYPF
jgi:gas vesicle protein